MRKCFLIVSLNFLLLNFMLLFLIIHPSAILKILSLLNVWTLAVCQTVHISSLVIVSSFRYFFWKINLAETRRQLYYHQTSCECDWKKKRSSVKYFNVQITHFGVDSDPQSSDSQKLFTWKSHSGMEKEREPTLGIEKDNGVFSSLKHMYRII